MKTAVRFLTLITLGIVATTAATGCEVSECADDETEDSDGTCVQAESLVEYKGTPETQQVVWVAGTPVTIDGINGDIRVEIGSQTDTVDVEIQPYTYRGASKKEQAIQEINDHLVVEAGGDVNLITVTTGRSGDAPNLGADLVIRLPAGFDAALDVRNRGDGTIDPGEVELRSVGGATSLNVRNDSGIGDCSVASAPSVTSLTVDCESSIEVTGASGTVNVFGKGLNSDISVQITSIVAGGGGEIATEDGDITMFLPSAGDYSVQATALEGAVSVGSVPAACNLQTAGETGKTVTCGAGGPNYVVNAGTDCVGDCNISLNFQ